VVPHGWRTVDGNATAAVIRLSEYRGAAHTASPHDMELTSETQPQSSVLREAECAITSIGRLSAHVSWAYAERLS
jgi:hypothetical protein